MHKTTFDNSLINDNSFFKEELNDQWDDLTQDYFDIELEKRHQSQKSIETSAFEFDQAYELLFH